MNIEEEKRLAGVILDAIRIGSPANNFMTAGLRKKLKETGLTLADIGTTEEELQNLCLPDVASGDRAICERCHKNVVILNRGVCASCTTH